MYSVCFHHLPLCKYSPEDSTVLHEWLVNSNLETSSHFTAVCCLYRPLCYCWSPSGLKRVENVADTKSFLLCMQTKQSQSLFPSAFIAPSPFWYANFSIFPKFMHAFAMFAFFFNSISIRFDMSSVLMCFDWAAREMIPADDHQNV